MDGLYVGQVGRVRVEIEGRGEMYPSFDQTITVNASMSSLNIAVNTATPDQEKTTYYSHFSSNFRKSSVAKLSRKFSIFFFPIYQYQMISNILQQAICSHFQLGPNRLRI